MLFPLSQETFSPRQEAKGFMRRLGITPRQVPTVSGPCSVAVDYDAPDAIPAAILKLKPYFCGIRDVNLRDIPLGGTGEVLEQVRELRFRKVMYHHNLPAALKKKGQEDGCEYGYKFANPLTALLWALKNQDALKHDPVVTLFCIGGKLYFLSVVWVRYGLDVAISKNHVRTGKDVREGQAGNVRFLVVAATEDSDPMAGWPTADTLISADYPEAPGWVKFGDRVLNFLFRGLLSPFSLLNWFSVRR